MSNDTKKTESFLEQYNRAPESQKWSLVLRWFQYNSIEFFAELREKMPVLKTPQGILLANFSDIIEVVSQPSQFDVRFYKPKMGTYLMTQDDTSRHNTEKSIMLEYLEKLDSKFVRDFVGKSAKNILNKAKGKLDLGYSYARMVPALVVKNIFGLGLINPKHLIRWSYWNQLDTFHNQPFHMRADASQVTSTKKWCSTQLGVYLGFLTLVKLFLILIRAPGKDVASKVLAAKYPKSKNFSLPRQVLNIGGLLIGAVETTAQAVIQSLNELFNRPEMLTKAIQLAKSGDNEKFDLMVWEALRFQATFKYMFRTCSSKYTLAKGTGRETVINPGETVFALIASGMFDPNVFKNPFEFDPGRAYGQSFHFGYGYHECMGKVVGMQMVPEMVRQVLLKENIKPDGPINYGNTPLPQNFQVSWSP